jgi:hypothetical protein
MAPNVRLKCAIIQAGYTQRGLARRILMAESRLSNIVQGVGCARREEREALAEALGHGVEHLFVEELSAPAV